MYVELYFLYNNFDLSKYIKHIFKKEISQKGGDIWKYSFSYQTKGTALDFYVLKLNSVHFIIIIPFMNKFNKYDECILN